MSFSLFATIRGAREGAARMSRAATNARRVMERQMGAATKLVEKDVKTGGMTGRARYSAFWGKMGADPSAGALAVRTGHTRASVTSQTFSTGNTVVGTVGTPQRHMRILEEGGVVSGSPMLRIPTAQMKTGAGVDRLVGKKATLLQNTWIGKSRRGNLFIFTRGRNGQVVALYMLKRTVKIKERAVFKKSLQRTRPAIVSTVGDAAVVVTAQAGL